MLGFREFCSQVVLKAYLSRKSSRKVRAVEVPFGGSKHKLGPGAPKCAIQVRTFLDGLFNLIKGAFHLPGLVPFDLRGCCGSTFVLLIFPYR